MSSPVSESVAFLQYLKRWPAPLSTGISDALLSTIRSVHLAVLHGFSYKGKSFNIAEEMNFHQLQLCWDAFLPAKRCGRRVCTSLHCKHSHHSVGALKLCYCALLCFPRVSQHSVVIPARSFMQTLSSLSCLTYSICASLTRSPPPAFHPHSCRPIHP